MMRRIVAKKTFHRFLVSSRNMNFTSKEESILGQWIIIAVSRNESYENVLRKDDIEQLTKFYLKTKLEELTHLASTLATTCRICKEKGKFIGYLIKENHSTKEIINALEGNFICQNIGKHPDIFIIKIQHLNIFSRLAKNKVYI